jgi:hypothetical protein
MSDIGEQVSSLFLHMESEQIGVYTRMQSTAAEASVHLRDAWKRPVRHNRRIERAALWYTLYVADDCDRLLDPNDRRQYLRPPIGEARDRYEAEAAIHTIPSVLPFTRREHQVLSGNKDRRNNFQFEHGIGDTALGQIALVERWHDWLWTNPESTSERRASPGPDAQVFAIACARLSNALGEIM